jgi:hypothetical protein
MKSLRDMYPLSILQTCTEHRELPISFLQGSVEIVLRRGEGGRGRTMEGINPTKIYYKHIGKYHNVFPCTTIIC